MSIRILVGDLLEATEDIIVHQVNCRKKMGSGIALQIKIKFPEAYMQYRDAFTQLEPEELLGKIQIIKINDKYICNLFGQLDYGYDGMKYTSYDALDNGFNKVFQYANENNLSVAIPYKIGSDRGGASWNVVYTMLQNLFEESKIQLTIYKLEEN